MDDNKKSSLLLSSPALRTNSDLSESRLSASFRHWLQLNLIFWSIAAFCLCLFHKTELRQHQWGGLDLGKKAEFVPTGDVMFEFWLQKNWLIWFESLWRQQRPLSKIKALFSLKVDILGRWFERSPFVSCSVMMTSPLHYGYHADSGTEDPSVVCEANQEATVQCRFEQMPK